MNDSSYLNEAATFHDNSIFSSAQDDVKASGQKLVTADGTYATQSAFTSKATSASGSGEERR